MEESLFSRFKSEIITMSLFMLSVLISTINHFIKNEQDITNDTITSLFASIFVSSMQLTMAIFIVLILVKSIVVDSSIFSRKEKDRLKPSSIKTEVIGLTFGITIIPVLIFLARENLITIYRFLEFTLLDASLIYIIKYRLSHKEHYFRLKEDKEIT